MTGRDVSAPRHAGPANGAVASSDMRRLGLLIALWLSSMAAYALLLLLPYRLTAHLATPRVSLGVIGNRQPRAAAEFLLCFALTFLFYALAYRVCRNWRSRLGVPACLAMGVLMAGLLALVYPIGATDVFDYIVQGQQLALRGLNPLTVPAAAAPDLPLIRYAAYSRAISPYGPVWILLQGALVKVASGGGLLSLTLAFKAAAIAGYVLTCGLIVAVLKRRAPQATVAGLVAFAWNPLVLSEVAVNAHNDIWIAALIVAAVLFWELRRPLAMLASLTLAVLIKAFAAPLLPLFALAAWRREHTGARMRLAIGGALTVAALTAVPYLLLPEGLEGMGALLQRTELFTHSLPAASYYLLTTVMPKERAAVLVGGATTALFGTYALVQLLNAWRQPKAVVRLAFNLLLFLMLLCMPWFQPWYLLPVMALGAVYPRGDAPFQAALSTACVVVAYVIFAFVWFWWPPLRGKFLGVNLLVLASTYALPWIYAVWSGLRGRRPAYRETPGR